MFANISRLTRFALTAGGATAAGVALAATAVPAHADDHGGWATVHAHGGLNVRSAPTTHAAAQGHLANGLRVLPVCRASGTGMTDGGEQWDTTWYYLSLGTGSGGWVSGHYLRTSGHVDRCSGDGVRRGRTTATLNLREAPSTADHVIGRARAGSTLKLVCKVGSQKVTGNATWYLTKANRWVSAAYVRNIGAAPGRCD